MKTLSKCPVCNDNMLHEYGVLYLGTKSLIIRCLSKLDHGISFIASENTPEEARCLTIDIIKGKKYATWLFDTTKLGIVITSAQKLTHLPFFEPDLSQYKKLMKKLKNYIIFS